jgi:hypothetical protein
MRFGFNGKAKNLPEQVCIVYGKLSEVGGLRNIRILRFLAGSSQYLDIEK